MIRFLLLSVFKCASRGLLSAPGTFARHAKRVRHTLCPEISEMAQGQTSDGVISVSRVILSEDWNCQPITRSPLFLYRTRAVREDHEFFDCDGDHKNLWVIPGNPGRKNVKQCYAPGLLERPEAKKSNNVLEKTVSAHFSIAFAAMSLNTGRAAG